ncbi:23S rRNA pseudouridine(2605) synthase RluB [Natronospira bacteriovora]|uniref:Pseudouridine synthase n=1 Tax=Natronospira bacteriovora TaxID=3069753 RepID=A0ABU0W5E2_9GAMM|nr:pseudouridine synthase [Natronospira sp. AB-CW4]MDQ2069164.1 pseudouridine synthase [Natronospira sp. AB-CW4]
MPNEDVPATETLPRQRIQKLLANAGYGSRREIEGWITAGRILINGRPAGLGDQAGEGDHLTLDGNTLSLDAGMMPERRVILYHKPIGEITTRKDPEGRPTVFEQLPRLRRGRWVAVGRLDYNTSGLMVLTTDGQLAARLMHPSRQLVREYAVRIWGEISDEAIERLIRGVVLDDGPARFESITQAGGGSSNQWFHVILREGRYREVRRLFEAVGVTVSRLVRVRYGPVSLPPDLPRGHWRDLKAGEIRGLMDAAGLEADAPLAEAPEKQHSRPSRDSRAKKGARAGTGRKRENGKRTPGQGGSRRG